MLTYLSGRTMTAELTANCTIESSPRVIVRCCSNCHNICCTTEVDYKTLLYEVLSPYIISDGACISVTHAKTYVNPQMLWSIATVASKGVFRLVRRRSQNAAETTPPQAGANGRNRSHCSHRQTRFSRILTMSPPHKSQHTLSG